MTLDIFVTDDPDVDFTDFKTVGPVDSDNKVIGGCANNAPLITLVKSIVDLGDVVVVGCHSQFIVVTDSFIDLETVLVCGSTTTDDYFELTKTTLNFLNLESLPNIESNSLYFESLSINT
ncbi:hypothetical protein P9112_010024 [Eukaryota sp. TZLM1-RC]